MRQIFDFPPNYPAIVGAIPEVAFGRPVFSWGTDIYNPYRLTLDKHLNRHESVHGLIQQPKEGSPERWWEKYLWEADFRLDQELEAYRAQLASFMTECRDREKVHRFVWALALQLSGPLYGRLLSHSEALKRLRV